MATWKLDPSHTAVMFHVRHLMIAKIHGRFDRVSGQIDYDVHSPEQTKVEVHIQTESINTGEPKRDEHLKGSEFFDTKKYPEIIFRSKHIERKSEETFKVTGDLQIHGQSREIILDTHFTAQELKDPFGVVRIVVAAATVVNRKDFGLTWNAPLEAGGVLVGDEVQISVDAQFTKAENTK